ncbi:MAG: hypothetical protein H7Z73_06805 [Candidatus Saccharibacteria bacterium]|nr:hypothetical protein [Moraxellaceae bacterium]
MLSREQLQELGRFKLLMRKMHHQSVQIERFLTDLVYQTQMLDIAEEFDDTDLENDELMMLSLILRSKFGRLGHGDDAYASIVPVAQPVVEFANQAIAQAQKSATPQEPPERVASGNSVSLLRSIGNSLASALQEASSGSAAVQTALKSSVAGKDLEHPEEEKNHYVMSLR